MRTSKYFTLKEARLSNNCPECYSNDGLEVTFKQKFTENSFYKAITADVISEIHCYTCNSQIFPIQWTDDMDSVVEYQRRAVQPKSKSTKLKSFAWALIFINALLVLILVLFLAGIFSF